MSKAVRAAIRDIIERYAEEYNYLVEHYQMEIEKYGGILE